MGSVPPLLLIGTGVVLLGNLLHIVGLGTPNWLDIDVLGNKFHSGLFKSCPESGDCKDIEDPDSSLEATQAMVIMGMLSGLLGAVLAVVFVIFRLISKSAPKIFTIISAVACFAACLLIIIGVIIFAAEIYDSDYHDYGFSFALCIVGALLLAVGGVLIMLGGKSAE